MTIFFRLVLSSRVSGMQDSDTFPGATGLAKWVCPRVVILGEQEYKAEPLPVPLRYSELIISS
jgi:hypothetical protein